MLPIPVIERLQTGTNRKIDTDNSIEAFFA